MRAYTLAAAIFAVGLCLAQSTGIAGLVKYTPPIGYRRDDARAPEGRIAYFAKEEDHYSASVMLKSYGAGSHTAVTLGRETVAEMRRASDIKVLTHNELWISGKPAYSIRLDIDLGNGMKVAQRQVLVVHRGRVVAWTCSALASKSSGPLAKFERSLKTVTWL